MERELSLLKKKLDEPAGVTFRTIGIGPEIACQKLRSLLKPEPGPSMDTFRALLLLGFASAVETSLKPGDLILSSRYYRAAASSEGSSLDSPLASADRRSASLVQTDDSILPDFLEPDPWMRQQAVDAVQETALRVTPSPSLTVDRVIDSPEDKRAIFDRYSVATVNMEDYAAAAAALEAGVPFLSVRAVLDVADQRLPGYLAALSVTGQSISGSRAVLSTLLYPWRIATLLRLAIQMRRAQWALAQFALSFIAKMTYLPQAAAQGSAAEAGNSGRPLKCVQSPASPSRSNAGLTTGLIS